MNQEFIPQAQLDFHEYGELFPVDIEQILNEFIEDCYISDLQQILIITGKGRVVRPLVQNLLNSQKHVASFKTAGYFNGQTGAFEVILL